MNSKIKSGIVTEGDLIHVLKYFNIFELTRYTINKENKCLIEFEFKPNNLRKRFTEKQQERIKKFKRYVKKSILCFIQLKFEKIRGENK
jgi:hypothetical protein